MFSGCAGKLTANKTLIEQFTPPVIPEKNETLVYVIRQSSMLGAARGLYVGINDKVVADLYSGTYCYFKINDGINTLNLEQGTIPFSYYRLANRPGKTVYLYFEMTSGKLSEITEDLGITAIMKSQMAKDIGKPKNNKGYLSALINPGFLNLYLMKETTDKTNPDTENANITFIRPQSYAKDMAFGIWNESKFLGNLKGETYFQIKVPAGKHNFFGKSEHFSVLKADVEAGKNYYIQVAANMGWSQAHVKLLPIKSDKEQNEIQKWLTNSKKVTIDETAIDPQVKKRLNLALPHIKTALNNVDKGKAEARYLRKSDGR